MTPKEQKFCDEYLIDLNGTQAAIRAGYSEDSARQIGSENLSKPYIAEYIAARRTEIQNKTLLTQEWVLHRFKEISDRCVQAVPVMRFNPTAKSMEQETTINDDGEEVGVWTFDAAGANKATEMIGRHLGFFEKDNGQSRSIVNIDNQHKVIFETYGGKPAEEEPGD